MSMGAHTHPDCTGADDVWRRYDSTGEGRIRWRSGRQDRIRMAVGPTTRAPDLRRLYEQLDCGVDRGD